MERDTSVLASRINQQVLTVKLESAIAGHGLLKKKSDALMAYQRKVSSEMIKTRERMLAEVKAASFSVSQLGWAVGEQTFLLKHYTSPSATLRINCDTQSVSGVRLPVLEVHHEAHTVSDLTGLGKGGDAIQKCREEFITAINDIVKLASLSTSHHQLKQIIKVTNRRVNAIENVIIPRTEITLSWLISELEEGEREDVFRMRLLRRKKMEVLEEIEEKQEEELGNQSNLIAEEDDDVMMIV
ncbi:hypothetical protein RCL1_004214 [Eukaryota sp. TZLM3-RCL]